MQSANIIHWMKKPTRNYKESANIRMPDGLRQKIADAAKERDISTWSANDEYVYRLKRSFLVPDDIVQACVEMGDVKDRLDFAVKLFKRAGFNVSIPEK